MPSAARPDLGAGERSRGLLGPEVRLAVRWPSRPPGAHDDNVFLGAWHPWRRLRVDWTDRSPTAVERSGPNWTLVSTASPLHPEGTGLVHQAPDRSTAVAFRGYVLPALHSYSSGSDITGYWGTRALAEHNGVFTTAVVDDDGFRLTLVVDALGMGPLYYRSLGDVVLFSTNPRYLTAGGDRPDLLAWRYLLQPGWIASDRSLTEGVRRVPAGRAVRFSAHGPRELAWFGFETLGRGDRPVGPGAVGEVEEVFQESMRRCLQLRTDGAVLPLSSGFDSRRILGTLLARGVEFSAVTARIFQKEYRDLDARFAGDMARTFGFPHTVVQMDALADYVADDRVRRCLIDAESQMHTWAIRVMQWLPRRPSLFFDGIGGDILGDPVGWSVLFGLAVAPRSPEEEVEAIVTHTTSRVADSVLRRRRWPDVEVVRDDLRAYLRPFRAWPNVGELAFLLLRQRRAISIWSQQMVPPGHVVVCPYLDLDYLRLLLGFRSTEKHATKFQRACLRAFQPELYRFPGNRDIPADLPPGSPALYVERAVRCQAALHEEIDAGGASAFMAELFTIKRRALLHLSRHSRVIAERSVWWLNPVMELVARQMTTPPVWRNATG
jgi:hypothetical protein